jgi:DNA processing protein
MTEEDLIYSIALSVVSSPKRHDMWTKISWSSPKSVYKKLADDSALFSQDFLLSKYPSDPYEAARNIYQQCSHAGIDVLSYWDLSYPSILREIKAPPLVIYAKGRISEKQCIAIVGTRDSDQKSNSIARRISADLSQCGFNIVSGMAVGIDRSAHEAALAAGGTTIGIMANGIDIQYPSANRDIYKKIEMESGSAVISEYPPGVLAGKWTFARRNRIISGLSLATIVVKAGKKSGALITARFALEQGREIFACTGYPYDPGYEGCINLIKSGANPFFSADDVIEGLSMPCFPAGIKSCDREVYKKFEIPEINIDNNADGDIEDNKEIDSHGSLFEGLDPLEQWLISNIDDMGDIDELIEKSGRKPSEISESIVMLELRGLIKRSGTRLVRSPRH